MTETIFRHREKAPRTESPSLVDPRLQARRIEVARGQGRRRLRWVVAGVGVVGAVVGAFALTQSPALDIDVVAVHGATRTGQAKAKAAAGIVVGAPMISLDAPAVERRLEALPWVQRASVARSWPGTVRISLVERTPVAVAGSGDAAVAVDRSGRALGPADDAGLPVVAGAGAEPGERLSASQRRVVTALAGLPGALRSEVAEADATRSGGIGFTLTDGIEVRWGDTTQPTAKADALEVLLEQAGRRTIDTIDVSVPRAATVTRS